MTKHEVTGYENLHKHSDFSVLDGFAMVSEYAERQVEINQKFLCITDHGVMGAVPQQIKQSDIHNLTPIFGCEMYINPMQPKSENRTQTAAHYKTLGDGSKTQTIEQKKFRKSYHLLGIAYTNKGYSNLVKLTSWGWIHGYYYKPRINHEILKQHSEGIIFTSTCGNSEIANAFFQGREQGGVEVGDAAGFAMLEKYFELVGKENFYLELMMLDWKMQYFYNEFLIKAHNRYGVPLILSNDCHYCRKEHSHNQRLMLMRQKKTTIQEIEAMVAAGMADDLFELQDSNLWLKSEDELNEKWELSYSNIIDYELFKQAKANTVAICERSKDVQIDREIKLPMLPDAEDQLKEAVRIGFEDRGCPNLPEYNSRIDEELDLICSKGFASYFLIQKQMTDEARRASPDILGFGDGSEAVGPGRGSCAGSLVAYCLYLHDVEPIKHDLRFSRFLSPARGGKQMKIRHKLEPIPHQRIDV